MQGCWLFLAKHLTLIAVAGLAAVVAATKVAKHQRVTKREDCAMMVNWCSGDRAREFAGSLTAKPAPTRLSYTVLLMVIQVRVAFPEPSMLFGKSNHTLHFWL